MLCTEPLSAHEQQRQAKIWIGSIYRVYTCSTIYTLVAITAAARAFPALQLFLKNIERFYINMLAIT